MDHHRLTWDTIKIHRDAHNSRRLWFEPFGELDFIDMSAPVDEWRQERTRVVISTLAGTWFELRNASEPERPHVAPAMDWIIIALARSEGDQTCTGPRATDTARGGGGLSSVTP